MSANVIPAWPGINLPEKLHIECVDKPTEFYTKVGKFWGPGFNGKVMFGTAYLQGGRLMFTTATQMTDLPVIADIHRSDKMDSVSRVMDRSNRPTEKPQRKKIREYMLNTAFQGEKFFLPAFTMNYGVAAKENGADHSQPVQIVLCGGDLPGVTIWPAMVLLPHSVKLDITDGAHRWEVLVTFCADPKRNTLLGEQSVSLTIVFEEDRAQAHQDFADAGKSKSIASSLLTTFDVRDRSNLMSRNLVKGVEFLEAYCDATASSVNLSARSAKIWSMNAARMFVLTSMGDLPAEVTAEEASVIAGERLAGAKDFFAACVQHIEPLRQLDAVKQDKTPSVTPGDFRAPRGGSFLMRATGMAILARAFVYCRDRCFSYADMAVKLDTIDWHLFPVTVEVPKKGEVEFVKHVMERMNPTWTDFIRYGEGEYAIRASVADVDKCWARIETLLFAVKAVEAAPDIEPFPDAMVGADARPKSIRLR